MGDRELQEERALKDKRQEKKKRKRPKRGDEVQEISGKWGKDGGRMICFKKTNRQRRRN